MRVFPGRARCCNQVHDALLQTTSQDQLKVLCKIFKTPQELNPMTATITNNGEREPLLFSSLVPNWEKSPWPEGPALETALRLALWHINFCSDLPLLQKYYMSTKFFDDGCDASMTSKAFMTIIQQRNNLGIIGPSCSIGALPTAAFAPFLNQTMLSYSAEAFTLSDHYLYSTFYRLSASGLQYQAAWQSFINHCRWKRVAILLELGREFGGMITRFKKELIKGGKKIILESSFLEKSVNVSRLIEDVVRKDARVIFAATYPFVARRLMCLAHHRVRIAYVYTNLFG